MSLRKAARVENCCTLDCSSSAIRDLHVRMTAFRLSRISVRVRHRREADDRIWLIVLKNLGLPSSAK
jgi:hypothetical protein